MGIIIKHNKSTNVIPIKAVKCQAPCITSVLLSGAWKGKTCFLLGGGPSLKDFDFNLIKNYKTIGVNKSFTKFPTTINYAMDVRFYDMVAVQNKQQPILHQQWLAYKGIKLFLKRSGKFKFDNSVYTVNSLPNKAISFDLDTGIYGGNNSGFGALMLSCCLGCKRVGLLGYDLKVQKKQKGIETHWHGGYNLNQSRNFQSKLDKFRMSFEEFAPVIAEQGIEVINLVKKDEDSKLTCFPKDSLENFIR